VALGQNIDDDASLRAGMIELCRQGPKWVIVTLGAAGAVVCDGKSFWKSLALKVRSISPIGSGDAFTAGLASSIAAGQSVPDACRLATACAAANTLVPGAGFLRIHDVKEFVGQASVEPWQ
jgi:fructose-1-phosphate kinase PfkB-like protein